MNVKKVLAVSVLWIVFLYVLIEYTTLYNIADSTPDPNVFLFMNVTNFFLGGVLIMSVFMIIFGLVGYIWNVFKVNKDKEQKFKKMLICGVIIFVTIIITYGMLMPPIVPSLR